MKSRTGRVSVLGGPPTIIKSNVYQENRIYVTCQVDEDLPYILQYVGEDNLIVGSDYTHRDPSMELEFLRYCNNEPTGARSQRRRWRRSSTIIPKRFMGYSRLREKVEHASTGSA